MKSSHDSESEYFPPSGLEWGEADPEKKGWSLQHLKDAEAASARFGSAAVMVIDGGRVVAQWGDTSERFPVYSVRKSLLSALIGIEVGRGSLVLGSTLDQLGIDDVAPSLSTAEKQATVADLLKSRSGVYHTALYETPEMAARRPDRGTHRPGSFWYYNNWDFNTLGTIYEQATGGSVFDGFRRDLAEPIGMQDYRPQDGEKITGDASLHPACTFRMSARDLARFGLLYLRQGRWRDHQVLPPAWIKDSTSAHSIIPSGDGYGYMWWTSGLDGKALPVSNVRPEYRYAANGNQGQIVAVQPARGLVIVLSRAGP